MVLVLSDRVPGQESPLCPAQAVLLYQRCRLLLACLQYNSQLSQHLRSRFREEFRFAPLLFSHQCSASRYCFDVKPWCVWREGSFFPSRYFVKPSCAEKKLPPHYPISQWTVRLVEELLSLNRWLDACRKDCDRVCLSWCKEWLCLLIWVVGFNCSCNEYFLLITNHPGI